MGSGGCWWENACMLSKSGKVWCWVDNSYGQLGIGTRDMR
ncbi:hypothetical protein [Pajaroellobacter abortibovis]